MTDGNDDPFWNQGEPLPEPPGLPADVPSALEKLGPSPFPKSGFPFLGFLATVYDHIAARVGQNAAGVTAEPGQRG